MYGDLEPARKEKGLRRQNTFLKEELVSKERRGLGKNTRAGILVCTSN